MARPACTDGGARLLGLRVRVRDRLRVVAGARGWTRVRVRVRGLDGAHIQGGPDHTW